MVKIREHLVPSKLAAKVVYSGVNSKLGVVVHETDNTNKGANADAHARLQANGNSRAASWHYQVDDKEIVRSFKDDVQTWAASSEYYNKNYINVEICVNSDGDFVKAVNNTAELVKDLMSKYGIPKSRVITHKKASPQNKNCPRNLLNNYRGINWNDFLDMLDGKTVTPSNPAPKPPVKDEKGKLVVDGKWGPGTTREAQRQAGTPVDGVISKPSLLVKEIQKVVGAKVDGFRGPETYRKMQIYLGTPVDGYLSNPSLMVKEFQRRLNAGTFFKGESTKKNYQEMAEGVFKGYYNGKAVPQGINQRAKFFGLGVDEYKNNVQNRVNKMF